MPKPKKDIIYSANEEVVTSIDRMEWKTLTVPEVADLLRCTKSHIYHLIENNLIPYFRIGHGQRGVRFWKEEIYKWSNRTKEENQ